MLEVSWSGSIDIVAFYAAVVATIVLIWDIVKWMRSGPILKLRVMPTANIVSGLGERKKKDYVAVWAINVGNKSTTIGNMGVIYYPNLYSKILKKNAKAMIVNCVNNVASNSGVPYVLDVGKEWMGMVVHTDELVDMSERGYLYLQIYHSFSKRPVCRRLVSIGSKREKS